MPYTRRWECDECGYSVELSYEEVVEIGEPYCTMDDCERFDQTLTLMEEDE